MKIALKALPVFLLLGTVATSALATNNIETEKKARFEFIESDIVVLRQRGVSYPYLPLKTLIDCATDACVHQFKSYKQFVNSASAATRVRADNRGSISAKLRLSEFYSIPAKLRLAELYLAGYGIDKNETKALRIFRKEATKNLPYAEYMAAKLYFKLHQSSVNGLSYLKQSAEGNYPDAMLMLGTFYFEGKYLETDIALADKWLTKALISDYSKMSLAIADLEGKFPKKWLQLTQLNEIYTNSNNIASSTNDNKGADIASTLPSLTFAEFLESELEYWESRFTKSN